MSEKYVDTRKWGIRYIQIIRSAHYRKIEDTGYANSKEEALKDCPSLTEQDKQLLLMHGKLKYDRPNGLEEEWKFIYVL